MERSGGYFVTPFKGCSGVTQGVGGAISPTIFNVVVDVVLQKWVTVVALKEESVDPGVANPEGFVRYVQHLAAYFYAYDRLLTSTRVAHLRWAITTLTDIFDIVGLRTNVAKMVNMSFQPCHAIGGHISEDYGLSMKG